MSVDRLRSYFRKKGYSRRVVDGGFDYLLTKWKRFVQRLAFGDQLTEDEFLNEVDVRRILNEAMEVAGGDVGRQAIDELARADKQFKELTGESDTCVWGEHNARKHGYKPQKDWWYYRRVRKDLGARRSPQA